MSTVTNESPVSIIENIYNMPSTTSYQKQACLRYLLHYQHYNAELTKDKREELGHPMPLYTDQGDPGYIRTDKQTNELARPYVEKYLRKFYKNLSVPVGNNVDDYFDKSYKLTCHYVVSILKRMSSIRIAEIGHQEPDTEVLAVNVTTEDLKLLENVDENECKTLELIKKRLGETNLNLKDVKNKKISFFFLHGEENIDCVLMWAAKWESPKKSSNLTFLDIESNVFSILNKCGAFPDRLAINQFLTQTVYEEVNFQFNLKAFGIEYSNGSNQTDGPNLNEESWNVLIVQIRSYELEGGSKIYRDAFLKWLDIFFNKNDELKRFALPLLNSQVIPWISDKSTIDKWAKSYQNLCEIVMFFLDFFSETEVINQMKSENCLESIKLKLFDPSNKFKNKSCHIYSYGMSSLYIVLDQILNLDKFKNSVSVACISQNYFETLNIMEEMLNKKIIKFEKKDNLNGIEKMPDILIADIHPNNASRNRLHKNDIAKWISDKLKNDKSKTLILILDITLNNLTDEHLQSTLKDLNEFINNGKLEIFSIMSLAKLVQLGSDNFSGGLCFYLGDNKNNTNEISSHFIISQKYTFFGLLLDNFQDIISAYFKKIRENCNWMYDKLRENFNYIEKEFGLCATAITVNPDESTVYVAIGFDSILDKFNEKESDKSKLFISLKESLLKSAGKRELPITGRQSFGFPLSNMNLVGKFIRFSIGVENRQLLSDYADLITDFSHALTKYIAKIAEISSEFNMQTFLDAIDKVHDILSSKQYPITYEISYKTEKTDETIKANIFYGIREDKPQLILNIQINGVNKEIYQDSIELIKTYKDRRCTIPQCEWSYKYLFMLFFQLELELKLNLKSVAVIKTSDHDTYYIDGLLNSDINLSDLFNQRKVQLKDAKTNILITFEPEFSLTQDSKKYNAKNIYVIIESFGTIPVKFTKLDKKCRIEIFTKFLNYYFNASKKSNQDDILITFDIDNKRKSLNYKKKFKECIEAGLDGFVKYLNDLNLNLEDLPIFDQTWEEYSTATDTLHHIYNLLGSKEVGAILITNHITIEQLELIDNLEFKKNIVHGISSQIYESALSEIYIQFDDTILGILTSKKYFDYDQFKEWVIKLEGIVNNDNDMNLYFEAISKIVENFYNIPQDLYDIKFTTSLYNMRSHEKLKQVFDQKFNKISTFIEENTNPQIGHYLYFYINYSPIDEVKESLLKAVQGIEKNKLKDWIFSPLTSLDFICYRLDSLECFITKKYCEIVIDLKDGDKVNEFFHNSYFKSILLEVLSNEFKSNIKFAVRWAIITKDSELFEKISQFLMAHNENINENQLILKEYVGFLDVDNISQNEIKENLSRMLAP